jgi:hypothetical protein
MDRDILLLLVGGGGLVLATGFIVYGLRRLAAIARRQRELVAQHQQLFSYDQYKLAAQASLANARRATDGAARSEALRAGIAHLQQALRTRPEAPDADELQRQLEEWQRELEEIRKLGNWETGKLGN